MIHVIECSVLGSVSGLCFGVPASSATAVWELYSRLLTVFSVRSVPISTLMSVFLRLPQLGQMV